MPCNFYRLGMNKRLSKTTYTYLTFCLQESIMVGLNNGLAP